MAAIEIHNECKCHYDKITLKDCCFSPRFETAKVGEYFTFVHVSTEKSQFCSITFARLSTRSSPLLCT